MNVEKLYENAGIEYGSCQNYSRFEQCCNSPFCDSGMCPNGISGEKHPFTAEKQLELIKWLGELDLLEIMRTTRDTKEWIINSEYGMSGNVYKHASRAKTFGEALAKLINSLWQDLADTEKEQIKEILKG